jgi:ABC-type transport system involved in multi-copper enzyme maturation permease subunit
MERTVLSFSHTVRAELFRTLKQPLTWTLLLVLLVLITLNYRSKVMHALEPPEVENPFLPTPEESRQAVIYPNTFTQLQSGFHFSAFLSLMLTTITVSQAYHRGTVRTVLAREPRRGRLLLAQGVALAAVAALYLALIWLLYGALGAWGSHRLEAGSDLSFLDGPFLLQQFAMLLRIWLAILPVITFGLLVGIWTRHTATSVILGGMTYFLTWMSLMVFLGLVLMVIVAPAVEAGQDPTTIGLGIWGTLPSLSPIYNMNVVVHWGDLAMMSTDDMFVMAGMDVGMPRNPWHSLGLLCGYGALTLALARRTFWRQDVTV